MRPRKFLRLVLLPFSLLYGLVMSVRNLLYDIGIFTIHSFNTPLISIGNLSLGGTGKTPHAEYLIRLLLPNYRTATLSRGYGRSTSGFLEAEETTEVHVLGDEPLQFKRKFPDLVVAVDEKRVRGIKTLRKIHPDLKVILLDDAFQHRSVKPGLSVLLTDYSKLYIDDFVLPSGSLREWPSSSSRADIIVVTKTPEVFSPMERRILLERINPRPYQKVYFSYIEYDAFIPLNQAVDSQEKQHKKEYYFENKYSVLLVSGIASHYHLYYYVKNRVKEVTHLHFPDHYRYAPSDVQKIRKIFDNIVSKKKIILTTEKDAMRLFHPALQKELNGVPAYYVSIKVRFHEKDEDEFNSQVMDYVRRYPGNSRLSNRENA